MKVQSSTASKLEQRVDLARSGAGFSFAAYAHIGDRKTQEDRFVVCTEIDVASSMARSRRPQDAGGPIELKRSGFFGVFDGTVGDFASENVKELIVPTLLQQPAWIQIATGTMEHVDKEGPHPLERALRDAFLAVDKELLKRCAANGEHYATCTGVAVLIVGDLLAVAHVGDSRVIVSRETEEPQKEERELVAEAVTADHEPHLPGERRRIELNGGTVERLQKHGNKPYIRGGDFMMRKTLGEQPMQLQYSRAFGGKDLKVFGLTADPEVVILRKDQYVKNVILGSDGIWGCVSPQEAGTLAMHAPSKSLNPAEAVVRFALHNNARKKARSDNVTAVVISFD